MNQPLRILLVKPRPPRQNIRFEGIIRCEPLELEYLYTVLQGYQLEMLDGVADRRAPESIARAFMPDVVLFSACITDIPAVLRAAARLKQLPRAPHVFVGGIHAEVMPQHFFAPQIDGIFVANQLAGLVAALEKLSRGEDYRDVPGAVFQHDGRFVANSMARDPLPALPHPRRVLFAKRPHAYRYLYFRGIATVKTAFGCPNRCAFCFCREMNGGQYAARPIDDVLDEIEEIPTDTLFVVDDNFLVDVARLREFCDKVQARGMRKRFIIYGTTHFVAHHPALMAELRRAGVEGLIAGLEFITDDALASVNKTATREDNDAAIRICRELDIELLALFIVNPQWRHADFRRLARYVTRRHIRFATFATLTPLPGTAMSREETIAPADHPWWRYDLIRLHERPKHMPVLIYYLWIYVLYLLPGLYPATFLRLVRKCGLRESLRLVACGVLSGFEFLIKLMIWR